MLAVLVLGMLSVHLAHGLVSHGKQSLHRMSQLSATTLGSKLHTPAKLRGAEDLLKKTGGETKALMM